MTLYHGYGYTIVTSPVTDEVPWQRFNNAENVIVTSFRYKKSAQIYDIDR